MLACSITVININMLQRKLILGVFILFALSSGLFAHPHTFITTKLGIEFVSENLKGAWVHWEFDEMFSAPMIVEADMNKNGKFEKDELDFLYENAFSNLESYGYFFYMREGKKRKTAEKVASFSAYYKKNKLFYKFFIPIKQTNKKLIVSIFDPTYFCAVKYYKKSPVYFIKNFQVKAKYSINKNKKFPVYFNPAGAVDDETVYTEWKPGLEKAYPEEVVVSY